MRWLMLVWLLLAAGCSAGYRAPHATTRMEFSSVAELEAAADAIRKKFETLAFESETAGRQEWSGGRLISFWRHREGAFAGEDVHARLTIYPSADGDYLHYAGDAEIPPAYPFLEVHIYELRPGGFSAAGIAVHQELGALLPQLGGRVIQLSLPQRGDDEAYRWYLVQSYLLGGAWWLGAWSVSMTLIGWPVGWLLHRLGLKRGARRAWMMLVGVALVTPMPFPTMFITLLLPNIAALLLGAPYGMLAEHYGMTLAVIFAASFALSVAAAFIFIRKRDPTPAS